MLPENQTTDTELQSPEEAATGIVDSLIGSGYSLSDRVAISKQFRKLLRTEAEEAQKSLSALIDSL